MPRWSESAVGRWLKSFSFKSLSAENKPQYLYEFIWINTLSTVYPISNLSAIQNDKRMNPQFHKSGYSETTVHFPPRAFNGSSNMLLESAAVLVSWDSGVFFALWGALVTGFTVLGEKMSSLKNRDGQNIWLNAPI